LQIKKVYIETYGCQMNVSDSEVVLSVLKQQGYTHTTIIADADLILINTCSVRENAEQRIFGRLGQLIQLKKQKPGLLVGIIGCMAERLRETLFDQGIVSIVMGPDAYRYLPALIHEAEEGRQGINVILSDIETYDDIEPVRMDSAGVSSFVSIMRGCNNFCTYCIVPYTRGRERSRDPQTILAEISHLIEKGYKEVTLLGQNVNSYHCTSGRSITHFPELIAAVAQLNPRLRVRFTTSHPKDLSDELLHVIAQHPNICRHIHLPVQSGSTAMLTRMNRSYTREWYLNRVEAIRSIVPECAITTDIIAGFSGETDHDHQQTIALMNTVQFDFAFMFRYSLRPGTLASEQYADDVPEEIKSLRLEEIIQLQNKHSALRYAAEKGKTREVLIEQFSKKSTEYLSGRTSQNKIVVFPKKNLKPGDYANVTINQSTQATLIGEVKN